MGGWQEDEGAACHVAALILHKAVAPGLPLKIHGRSQRATQGFFFLIISASAFSPDKRCEVEERRRHATRTKDNFNVCLGNATVEGEKTTLEKGINIKDSQLVKTFKMILIYKQLQKQHLVKHLMIQS